MISLIMKHEWRLLTRERILYLALPLYLLMLIYGVVNGTAWKAQLGHSVSEAKELADAGFASKVAQLDQILAGKTYSYAEDPRLPAQLARYKGYEMATKPPSATSAIAIGQSDIMPSYLKVQWKPMFKQTNTDENANPQNLAAGAFDLGFVLIYLYPLLIIALSFNLLSSERENGTQVLLLSQPVTVSQFVLGKIMLRGGLVIGGAVIVTVFGLLIANPDIVAAGHVSRLGVLTLVLALYGSFWFGLSILVNALGYKSSTNALMLMGTWITLVLIVPVALNLFAKALYPLPSRIEMVQALRKGEARAENESKFDRSYRADLLRKGEEAALEASNTDFYLKVLPLEKQAEAIAAPIFDRFARQRAAQQELTGRLKYMSPAVVAQIALTELANNSAENYNDFNDQVEAYHQTWRDYFMKPVMENRILTREELRDIPRFTYRPENGSIVAGRLIPQLLGMLVFALVAIGAGFLRLRNYAAAAR